MGGVSPLPFPIILGLKPAAPGPLAKKGGNDRHAPYLRGGGKGGREGGAGARPPLPPPPPPRPLRCRRGGVPQGRG